MIHGFLDPRFYSLRTVLQANFEVRGETGASLAIVHEGKIIANLWGGFSDKKKSQPWSENTLVNVFSVTKGLSSMCLLHAASQGFFDFDEPVTKYWPEFGSHGKSGLTVAQVLEHSAGIPYLGRTLSLAQVNDFTQLKQFLENAKPLWQPGRDIGYHAYTLGWFETVFLQIVDPKHRRLASYFRDEIAEPLGLDFHVCSNSQDEIQRCAYLHMPNIIRGLFARDVRMRRFLIRILQPWNLTFKTFMASMVASDVNSAVFKTTENPGFGGFGTALSIARAYGLLATDPGELGISSHLLQRIGGDSPVPENGQWDRVLGIPMKYVLGFMKPTQEVPFGSGASCFGAPGAGGAFAFGDPKLGLGYAYVANRFGLSLIDDEREVAIRKELYRVLGSSQ